MRKIITYGTFDLFHEGHYNLLKRAKELGDYLIVGVTTDNYDKSRGKLNVQENLMKRISNVENSGLADKIVIEEHEGQKIEDILKYEVDTFVIGSDWKGKFDYLKEYCDVIYLDRTKGISSTCLREEKNNVVKLGVVGYGRICERFIYESKYVSGVNIEGVFGLNPSKINDFKIKHELDFSETNYDTFLDKVNAVYIASPHLTHYNYAKEALLAGKHVICEKPMVLSKSQAMEIYNLAEKNNLVLIEAIKTAYCPGFQRLITIAKSGAIGKIKDVQATFTKLCEGEIRELDKNQAGGSVTELATYPLLAIIKLLGDNIKDKIYISYNNEDNIDMYSKIILQYADSVATANVGLGVKSEGSLVISGTKGYIYVPAPWWKTEYFEIRYENINDNSKYFYKFEGDGLRYELAEFIYLINSGKRETYKLTERESIAISEIIEDFINKKNHSNLI